MEFFEKNHLASDKSVGFIWTRAAAELSQEMFFLSQPVQGDAPTKPPSVDQALTKRRPSVDQALTKR